MPGRLVPAALAELAELHVRFEDPARLAAVAPWATSTRGKTPDFVVQTLRHVIDHCADQVSDAYLTIAALYLAHGDAIEACWDAGPQTLIHGDAHIGNLFVDGDRVGFLDFGMARIRTPLRDVSFFLTMGVDADDRRRDERAWIQHYLDVRRALGGSAISFEDAWLAHRIHAAYTVIASFLSLVPPYNTEARLMFTSNFRRRAMANQYAYMLENFDSDWNYIGTKRDGRYTNLPGGTYALLLKGSNSEGVWNEQPLRIHMTVVPPFWQRLWIRALMVIVLIFAIAGGYGLRVRGVQKRNGELEHVVQERTRALEKRGQEMEALYQADEKILRNVSLNQVFQTLVDVSVDMLHADRSVVFAWDDERTRVVPRVSHGFAPKTLKVMRFAKGEGIVGQVLATGQAVIAPELNPDDLRPDVREAILDEGIQSFVHLPITVDNKVVAVFNVGFTSPIATAAIRTANDRPGRRRFCDRRLAGVLAGVVRSRCLSGAAASFETGRRARDFENLLRPWIEAFRGRSSPHHRRDGPGAARGVAGPGPRALDRQSPPAGAAKPVPSPVAGCRQPDRPDPAVPGA